ncbi:YihY/virulence factor BrkB family protein [Ornithinimicrobium sufpigmenti]|uniref:YihY/virulence factor BrkB family protein n=1 Tax=Ornithinimicrobium sufpigmenti TaxID=2508882 RepID=UPI0015E1A61E|nr:MULTISPECIES: YihY/virulence factor BrkB family protein [unclassified Ornithinimicrobium]
MASAPGVKERLRRLLAPVPGALPAARLVAETASVAFRYRATGLAAEAAFFLLLSLPPLLLGLVAGAGFSSRWLGEGTLTQMQEAVETWSLRFLTPETVEEVIMPTLQQTLSAGRVDVLSVSFVVALWSGSRALNIVIEAIAIMYGQGGDRGPVRARLLSLSTYLLAILVMGLTLPLLLIGPGYLRSWLPTQVEPLIGLYWPLVAVVGILSLTGLFHVATPDRSPYFRDLPGALLTVVIWVVSSTLIRVWAEVAVGGVSVFGPLTAPIVLMIYLYFLALAVLIGAALNAAIRRLWPPPEYRGPRARVNEWRDGRRDRDGSDQRRGGAHVWTGDEQDDEGLERADVDWRREDEDRRREDELPGPR